jgi:hypothetical protein
VLQQRAHVFLGAARGEAPLGYAEPAEETVVEYDEDVIQSLREIDELP